MYPPASRSSATEVTRAVAFPSQSEPMPYSGIAKKTGRIADQRGLTVLSDIEWTYSRNR